MNDLQKAAEMVLSGLETIRNLLQESKIEHAENHAAMIELVLRQALAQEPDDERIAALRTLDYCHGLKAGWNFCATDDEEGFESAMASTSEAVRVLKKQPALAQPKQKYDYRIKYDRPCFKCRSNFCPGNCKEPEYLEQLEQESVECMCGICKLGKREWVGLTDQQRAVLNFLLGADELDGVWFGDQHPKETGLFWWRNRLRNAFQDGDIEAKHCSFSKLKDKNT